MTVGLIVESEGDFPDVPELAQLQTWAAAAVEQNGEWEVYLRVVDREESRQLNHDYRGGTNRLTCSPFLLNFLQA